MQVEDLNSFLHRIHHVFGVSICSRYRIELAHVVHVDDISLTDSQVPKNLRRNHIFMKFAGTVWAQFRCWVVIFSPTATSTAVLVGAKSCFVEGAANILWILIQL